MGVLPLFSYSCSAIYGSFVRLLDEKEEVETEVDPEETGLLASSTKRRRSGTTKSFTKKLPSSPLASPTTSS
ncbi:hypothetical protein QOT17_021133 [Balamuthia mandrillaris]